MPHDFYSYTDKLQISLKSSSNGDDNRFKIQYGLANCNLNYTSEQGRILHSGHKDCWLTILAPYNHTIALYFNHLSIFGAEACTDAALQVREGDFSGDLKATLCGGQIPSPIFSIGNKLSLHSWSEGNVFDQHFDITYTTTNKGIINDKIIKYSFAD